MQAGSELRGGQTGEVPLGFAVPHFQHSENCDSRISPHFGHCQEGPEDSGRGSPAVNRRISSKAAPA